MSDCEGCIEYNKEIKSCYMLIKKLEPECPCRNCIIKVMCHKECHEFQVLNNSERNDSLPIKEEK